MIDYTLEIEKKLGQWRKLPDNPFLPSYEYVIFPSLDDDLVTHVLYEALFRESEKAGNSIFIVKSIFDIVGDKPGLLIQNQPSWEEFDSFQGSGLSYEGLYITGSEFNWLGIYHPDDYVIIGGESYFIKNLCQNIYGDLDWRSEFEKAYREGRLNMYESDFKDIKNLLLK
jgi:hypothetical protein